VANIDRYISAEAFALEGKAQRLQPLKRFLAEHEDAVLGLLAVAAFVVIWEVVIDVAHVSALFMSPPSKVFAAARNELASDTIWHHLGVSGIELVFGYVAAAVVGIPLGVLFGWYRRAKSAAQPFISFFSAVPRVAFLPVIVVLVGIGIVSKEIIVFISAVFPIIFNTIAGMQSLDANLVKCARSFGANDRQIFRTVALPGSVPMIVAGLRLGVGHGLVGVVVGELYAATAGLGFYMAQNAAQFHTDKMFFALLVFGFAGMVLMALMEKVENRFQVWRPR